MSGPRWVPALAATGACVDAVAWCRSLPARTSLAEAWRRCDRGDWMLWLAGRTLDAPPWSDERKPLVLAAARCARLALPIYEARDPGDDRVRRRLDVTEAWCRGEATVEEAASRRAAYAAAYRRPRHAAEYAAYAAEYAAECAAECAAYAAEYAAECAAEYAAYAAEYAAECAAKCAAEYAAECARVLRECAAIVREVWPTPPAHVYRALGLRAPRARRAA